MTSLLPVLLFLLPFLGALLCALVGWFARPLARMIALSATSLGAALSVWTLLRTLEAGSLRTAMGGWRPPLGIEWVVDPFSGLAAVLVSCVALVTVLGVLPGVRAELKDQEPSFYACVLLLLSGLIGMVVSNDLFNVFVHLEVASLSAYALVASGSRGAPSAALKYLIMGSVGASLYLLGVGFIYAATGSLNMTEVAALLSKGEPRLVSAGCVFIISGLAVKMGLFPVHGWMPAAYARASTSAAALMAPLVTKISALVLIRVLYWVYGAKYLQGQNLILEALGWGGIAAILFGGVLAFAQDDLRRMLAYSSISQMGVVALGVALANTAGLTGAMLHAANDALMKAALFLACGTLAVHFGITKVQDLARLRGRAPWLSATIAIAGLSLIGIPPLCGFFGKWYVLSGALQSHRYVWAGLLVVGSMLSVAYVFRLFEKLYFAPVQPQARAADGPWLPVCACGVLALLVIALGVASERVVSGVVLPALPAGL